MIVYQVNAQPFTNLYNITYNMYKFLNFITNFHFMIIKSYGNESRVIMDMIQAYINLISFYISLKKCQKIYIQIKLLKSVKKMGATK